jgi:RNA polymerase sigma factor (sigma-70 family)
LEANGWTTERFEERRTHLRAIAFRMLGSLHDADDAVQETWLRLNRSSDQQVENWEGWTVTVLTHICLDILRRRKSRIEEPIGADEELGTSASTGLNPEQEAAMAEAVGIALLVVLNKLAPAERLAFVMHDMFGISFEEIALILEKTPVAARQLASRARRRVRSTTIPSPQMKQHREVIESFLASLRAGDMNGIMAALHPNVVRRADSVAVPPPGELVIVGNTTVAKEAATNVTRARFAQTALINGQVGIIVAPHGNLAVALQCKVSDSSIIEFNVIAKPEHLLTLYVEMLPNMD